MAIDSKKGCRVLPGIGCRTYHCGQVRLHGHAESGQAAHAPAPIEKRTAQLRFQLLDGKCQRRLSDTAAIGRASEVLLLAERKKVMGLLKRHHRGQVLAPRGRNECELTHMAINYFSPEAAWLSPHRNPCRRARKGWLASPGTTSAPWCLHIGFGRNSVVATKSVVRRQSGRSAYQDHSDR